MAAHDGIVLPAATQGRVAQMSLVKALGLAAAAALIAILAFARLTEYPAIWFDEGIHLHVPKAVVTFGEYADYSSDGFRYYGPTMSVGPTVLRVTSGIGTPARWASS